MDKRGSDHMDERKDLPDFIMMMLRWYSQFIADLCGAEPTLSSIGVGGDEMRDCLRQMVPGRSGSDVFIEAEHIPRGQAEVC